MNSFNGVGRLTRDVDLRYTQSGKAVGNFNLAINRSFKNANGEYDADFLNCVIWDKAAENLANFVKKGDRVGVTGRIQTRTYDDNDGKKIYVTEVVVENVQYLESKQSNQPNNQNNNWNNNQQTNYQPSGQQNAGQPLDIDDSDLPF